MNKKRLPLLVFGLLLFACIEYYSTFDSFAGKKMAVLVGISQYSEFEDSLRWPAVDVTEIGAILVAGGYGRSPDAELSEENRT